MEATVLPYKWDDVSQSNHLGAPRSFGHISRTVLTLWITEAVQGVSQPKYLTNNEIFGSGMEWC